MSIKGVKQVANIEHNAILHPYYTLMCNSTMVRMISQQMKQ